MPKVSVTLYCDRYHNPLEEPITFKSHKEALEYLDRGYHFIYRMIQLGEAVDHGVWNGTISPSAQEKGRIQCMQSQTQKNEARINQKAYNKVSTQSGAYIKASQVAAEKRSKKVEYPIGSGIIYDSLTACSVANGSYGSWWAASQVKKGNARYV